MLDDSKNNTNSRPAIGDIIIEPVGLVAGNAVGLVTGNAVRLDVGDFKDCTASSKDILSMASNVLPHGTV